VPLTQYDKYFGGKPGSAQKAAVALKEEYGTDDGKKLFYAIVQKRKNRGTV